MPTHFPEAMAPDARALVVGAAGGVVATAAMSALMVAAREAGLMSELPPHVIAEETVDRAGADGADGANGPDAGPDEGERQLGWAAHFAFGSVAGALYGLLRRRIGTPGPAIFHGSTYALGIWAVSYLGWIPALRFLPPATRDEPGRPPVMVAAHLAFGAILGVIVERAVSRR